MARATKRKAATKRRKAAKKTLPKQKTVKEKTEKQVTRIAQLAFPYRIGWFDRKKEIITKKSYLLMIYILLLFLI